MLCRASAQNNSTYPRIHIQAQAALSLTSVACRTHARSLSSACVCVRVCESGSPLVVACSLSLSLSLCLPSFARSEGGARPRNQMATGLPQLDRPTARQPETVAMMDHSCVRFQQPHANTGVCMQMAREERRGNQRLPSRDILRGFFEVFPSRILKVARRKRCGISPIET